MRRFMESWPGRQEAAHALFLPLAVPSRTQAFFLRAVVDARHDRDARPRERMSDCWVLSVLRARALSLRCG